VTDEGLTGERPKCSDAEKESRLHTAEDGWMALTGLISQWDDSLASGEDATTEVSEDAVSLAGSEDTVNDVSAEAPVVPTPETKKRSYPENLRTLRMSILLRKVANLVCHYQT
jgi:hypothetical protein